MKDKLYLISEKELIRLVKNNKNMEICLNNELINTEEFGSLFIEWITEKLHLEGTLDKESISEEYDNWARDFIEGRYYSFDFEEEEESIPTLLN